MYKKTIIIDFDGTLCDFKFPEVGKPKEGVREALEALMGAGYEIVIHSCRTASYWDRKPANEHRNLMEKFLIENMIPWHSICAYDKPVAHYYIDDRGIPFKDNWSEITKQILGDTDVYL